MMSFGTVLRTARARRGLTLEQLAKSMGLSVPRLSHIERDREPLPDHELVCGLAASVGLPAEVLMVEISLPVSRLSAHSDRFVAYRRAGGRR